MKQKENNMELSNKDLLRWMILKEKIKGLNQQIKWTGDSIVSLERCQEDFNNIGIVTVQHARKRASEDLKSMYDELKILYKKLGSIENETKKELNV